MAQNETLIQVPANLNDSLSLRRFLLQLVEKLDIILGYRGQDPYISKSQGAISAETISSLPTSLSEVSILVSELQTKIKELTSAIEKIEGDNENNEQSSFKTSVISDIAYRDFNYSGYFTLKGFNQITALGSEFTNPPTALVGVTTYTVFIFSYLTDGGGVVQEVFITSPTTKTFHKRAGNTSALALSLGWF